MSDAIEGVSGIVETQGNQTQAEANFMQEVEFQDITNTNLTQQINKTYEGSLTSLADSTDDPAIDGTI